ncbi:MAG: tyrosine-type recombinase/integrase, partial [Desulforhabdus sp.]|nr:tyrosine-type recombinase/integrase [Desulforhabdus sp.]
FLYKQVLDQDQGRLEGVVRANKPARLSVVFTVEKVHGILVRLQGAVWLTANLLYCSGLRLMECARLRVKDIDFQYRQLVVREGKAGIAKQGSCHSLRHSFATHLLQSGYDIRTGQEPSGHSDANITMVYTHVLNRGGKGVRSPWMICSLPSSTVSDV